LYNKFQNNILAQWPRIACVYCGKLLYPDKADWIFYDPSIIYPLQQKIPDIVLTFHPDTSRIPELRIPTCNSCKDPLTRYSFPHLSPIPEEIASVPLHKRKYLSPVYLHCSLGRTPNSNPYSEYRSLVGTMNYSRNIRAHALYSGIIGAFLEPDNNNNNNNTAEDPIHNETLRRAASWLSQNNPYLRPFAHILSSQPSDHQNRNNPFPRARHIQSDTQAPPVNTRDIIIPNYDFPNEVHNEDFHYTRLMAGFVQESENLRVPILTHDPNLEPLLFPDIFTDGKGHFHDTSLEQDNETCYETYGKYIKQRLMNFDPRWRLHHYWPSWSYLQLEKLRHHQNTQRLLRQAQLTNSNSNNQNLPSARALLRPSAYTPYNIIDENI